MKGGRHSIFFVLVDQFAKASNDRHGVNASVRFKKKVGESTFVLGHGGMNESEREGIADKKERMNE